MPSIDEVLSLTPDNYGPFWAYVSDDEITDCDFNGSELWLTDTSGTRTRVIDHGLTEEFIRSFSQRVANKVSKPFNKMNPLLEAETPTLRISIVHNSAAVSGISVCLRKSLPQVRMTAASILEQSYMPYELMCLLANCIKAKMNMVAAGEPGAGKTESAKFFTQFIPDSQRVITIEDSPEWHFRTINPGHDAIEMRVSEEFSYSDAIKTCLRQNPKWIMLSEARGEEAKWLITSWSTGVNGVTTIHTDDIRKIPSRIIAMMNDRNDAERMISDIYDFVNVAYLVRRKVMPDGTAHRYIDQMGFFYRNSDGTQGIQQLVKDGKFVSKELPEDIQFKFKRANVSDPFQSDEINAALAASGYSGSVAAPVEASNPFQPEGTDFLPRRSRRALIREESSGDLAAILEAK